MKWESINNIVNDFIEKGTISGDVKQAVFEEEYDDDGNTILKLKVVFEEVVKDEAESDYPVEPVDDDEKEEIYGKRDYHYAEGNM